METFKVPKTSNSNLIPSLKPTHGPKNVSTLFFQIQSHVAQTINFQKYSDLPIRYVQTPRIFNNLSQIPSQPIRVYWGLGQFVIQNGLVGMNPIETPPVGPFNQLCGIRLNNTFVCFSKALVNFAL